MPAAAGVAGDVPAAGWIVLAQQALRSAALRLEESWDQVENQLLRRADLVKSLLALARERGEGGVAAFTGTLSPWRKGSRPRQEEFKALQYEIVGTANRLAVERMRFNQAVEAYNRRLGAFPDGWIARAMGLKPQAFFRSQAVAGQGLSTGPQARPR